MAAEPSLDPLSTTMTSKLAPRWTASEARQARKYSRRFQLTTTTEMSGFAAALMPSPGRACSNHSR